MLLRVGAEIQEVLRRLTAKGRGMDRHFGCTACGKCCHGWLPLTLDDAIAHAGVFPLAVVWTPVRPVSKAFALTERLGTSVQTRDRKKLAVRLAPTAYLPPAMPCPLLAADNLCAIHADKPLRCRTMPFFPYREENDQADLLVPRPGWQCDVSAAAPVVYRDKAILDGADFHAEQAALQRQVPVLRAYAASVLEAVPGMVDSLVKAAMKPGGGHVVVGFASLLRRLTELDRAGLATAQIQVLDRFAERVSPDRAWAEYGRNYADWAWEMERLT